MQKDWYWIITLALFFIEREAIMEACFMLIKLIIMF